MAATICAFGNLVRDPVVREVGDRKVCSFTIGVRSNVKNDSGEYDSNFFDVSLWGRSVDYFMNKAQKGTGVYVTGTFSIGSYNDKNGVERTSYRISATDAQPLTRMKDANAVAQPAHTEAAPVDMDNTLPF